VSEQVASEGGGSERFEYSGRFEARALVVLPFFLSVAAGAGLLYQWLLDGHSWVMLNLFVPPLLGAACGVIGLAALRAGHVRNQRVAIVAALLVTLCGLAVAHISGLLDGAFAQLFTKDPAGPAWGLESKLSQGDRIPGTDRFVPPGLLLVGWFFEAVVVLWLGMALPLIWWTRAVYSEEQGGFVPSELLEPRYCNYPERMRAAFAEGGLERLRSFEVHPVPLDEDMGELRCRVFRAPEGMWMNVEWRGKLAGPRGRKQLRNVLVLRRLRVDEGFLESWLGPVADR
jgi:hypothetical protein